MAPACSSVVVIIIQTAGLCAVHVAPVDIDHARTVKVAPPTCMVAIVSYMSCDHAGQVLTNGVTSLMHSRNFTAITVSAAMSESVSHPTVYY